MLFQQYLRRLEYKHILEFQVWFLKMAFKGKLPHSLQKLFSEIEKVKANSANKELSAVQEEAIELFKAQIALVILYYQAYQVIHEFLFNVEPQFKTLPILEDLKKGPEFFYNKHQGVIDKGIEEIEKLKEDKINRLKNEIGKLKQ